MMRSLSLTLLLFIGLLGYCQDMVPGELIVMLDDNNKAQRLPLAVNKKVGLDVGLQVIKLLSEDANIWLYKYNVNAISCERIMDAILSDSMVILAQSNHYGIEQRDSTNDKWYSLLWGLNNKGNAIKGWTGTVTPGADIDAERAWEITSGGLTADNDTIVVAVIDGGMKMDHEDIQYWRNYTDKPSNNIDDDANGYKDDFYGWNAVSSNGTLTNDDHGTHVAGIIGAKGNNLLGITGVNQDVQIMPVQGIWPPGSSDPKKESTVIEAYGYVLKQRKLYNESQGAKGAFVVSTNSSFGVDNAKPYQFPVWCALYDSLGKQGILSSTATTNSSIDVDVSGDMPTNCTSNFMIACTRSNPDDSRSCGWGMLSIDIAAPGFSIYSTTSYSSVTYGYYGQKTGTSQATPHIAGAISLLYAAACPQLIDDYKKYPDSVALMMRGFLLDNVDTLPAMKGKLLTGGRLNLYNAVKAVDDYCQSLGVNHELIKSSNNFSIQLYPNPVPDNLNIKIYGSHASKVDVEITDLLGQIIKKSASLSEGIKQSVSLDVSELMPGVYLMKATDNNNETIAKYFIKQ